MLRQFRVGNNLPMHIRENTDLPRQKPQQLASAEEIYGPKHNSLP